VDEGEEDGLISFIDFFFEKVAIDYGTVKVLEICLLGEELLDSQTLGLRDPMVVLFAV